MAIVLSSYMVNINQYMVFVNQLLVFSGGGGGGKLSRSKSGCPRFFNVLSLGRNSREFQERSIPE